MERLQMSLHLHLLLEPEFSWFAVLWFSVFRINQIKNIYSYQHRVKQIGDFFLRTDTNSPVRLSSPSRASRFSYISVLSEKKVSAGNFPLIWGFPFWAENLFSPGDVQQTPPPLTTLPQRFKLNIAKAKQQCTTTPCDILTICEIEPTK